MPRKANPAKSDLSIVAIVAIVALSFTITTIFVAATLYNRAVSATYEDDARKAAIETR